MANTTITAWEGSFITPKNANLSFSFVIPSDSILADARQLTDSGSPDQRNVAKAIIDATEKTTAVRDAFASGTDLNLAPYFDHWFGDAIDSAHRLASSTDPTDRGLARYLIDLEQAIIKSKESFLSEAKRLNVRPKTE